MLLFINPRWVKKFFLRVKLLHERVCPSVTHSQNHIFTHSKTHLFFLFALYIIQNNGYITLSVWNKTLFYVTCVYVLCVFILSLTQSVMFLILYFWLLYSYLYGQFVFSKWSWFFLWNRAKRREYTQISLLYIHGYKESIENFLPIFFT